MKTIETKLPAGRIVELKELEDGSYVIRQDVHEADDFMDKFILIEAESLSKNDDFLKYETCSNREEFAKELILEAIEKGVKNFYRPWCDPSFVEDSEKICFHLGKKPAVGKKHKWWIEAAQNYAPERNSRLGTRLEYGAFLGVLIKELVADEASSLWAWNAVCNDSEELGHYWNSKKAKHKFEPTGSRLVCAFYDLANTCHDISALGSKLLRGNDDRHRVDTRRKMLKGHTVFLNYLKHASAEAKLGIHHILLYRNGREAHLARDTRDYILADDVRFGNDEGSLVLGTVGVSDIDRDL
jgi:hypothetical protein